MQADSQAVALEYLRTHRADLGLSDDDLSDVVVTGQNVLQPSGVTNVHLRQRFKGIEIVGAEMNVNVTRDGRVLNTGGSFLGNLAGAANRPAERIGAPAAAEAAARAVGLEAAKPFDILEQGSGPSEPTTLSSGGIASGTIPARLVYHRTGRDRARLAWLIEIDQPDGRHWWMITVDAETGKVLDRADRVVQGGSGL